MISVLASITLHPGKRETFLEIFKARIQEVREEPGCIEYFPAVDVESGLPGQERDENVVTIIEKWQSVEALKVHLATPGMTAYRDSTKELVAGLALKVLQQA